MSNSVKAGMTDQIILRAVGDLKPHPEQALMPGLAEADYEALEADIKVRGIQTPFVITDDGYVLCGHNRLRAALALGITEVLVTEVSDLSAEQQIEYVVLDNLNRRQLSPSQRAAIITNPKVAAALNTLKEQARQRQIEGGKAGGKKAGRARAKDRLEEIVPQADGKKREPQSRDLIGKRADVSGKLVVDAQLVWEKAPDQMVPILKGDKKPTLSGLARELRGKKSRPPVSSADARTLVQPEVTKDGKYEADLICVFRLSTKALGFVWSVSSGPCVGATLLQPVADVRDDKGRIGPGSALGRQISAIIAWPDTPKIEIASLIDQHAVLDVRFNKGRPKITIVPAEKEADGAPPATENAEDGALSLDAAEESPAGAGSEAPSSPAEACATSAKRRKSKKLWPSDDDEEPVAAPTEAHQVQQASSPTGEGHEEERRCRSCGESISDVPAEMEMCAKCEFSSNG
jgi:hypothetical protein